MKDFDPISRRDFLKLSGVAIVGLAANKFKLLNIETPQKPIPEFKYIDFYKELGLFKPDAGKYIPPQRSISEPRVQKTISPERSTPEFRYIGPYIDYESKGASDGERSGWVDPENSDRILVSTWTHGFWQTKNGGINWEQVNVPIIENNPRAKSTARDILSIPGTNKILVVCDSNLSIGSIDDPNWDMVNLPSDTFLAQTACILPDNRVLIGGVDYNLDKGVAVTNIQDIFNVINYNRANPESSKKIEWTKIKGIDRAEDWFMIRTIAHSPSKDGDSPGKIYVGGWQGTQITYDSPGTGLICFNDQNFQVIDSYSNKFEQPLENNWPGPMNINTIKSTCYKGHEIVLAGGQGTGKEIYNPDRPFLQIIVDGNVVPQELVNPKLLFETGGGTDLITPQRGIVICEETAEAYISTGFKEISRVSLDDILQGKVLNWERITTPPNGQRDTGALHMSITHRNSYGSKSHTPALMVCREIWASGVLPFQQVAMVDLSGPSDKNIFK